MKSLLRWLFTLPGISQAFASKVREFVLSEPRFAAKFYPYLPERASYLVETVPPRSGTDVPLAVAPRKLWWNYGESEEIYLGIGKDYVTNMTRILEESGRTLQSCSRILDFGSASGIMIRWLTEPARLGEVWGVDISGAHILWCQQNLSPPFKFATTTSFPHLPFEDSYFDLVYAGSVFTHIADLAEAWLLELRRIVRSGGNLYLTVHDEHTLELYKKDSRYLKTLRLQEHDREIHFSATNWDFFTLNRTPGQGGRGQAQVFYRREYLRRHWGQYLKVVSITPQSYGHQTAVLLQK